MTVTHDLATQKTLVFLQFAKLDISTTCHVVSRLIHSYSTYSVKGVNTKTDENDIKRHKLHESVDLLTGDKINRVIGR